MLDLDCRRFPIMLSINIVLTFHTGDFYAMSLGLHALDRKFFVSTRLAFGGLYIRSSTVHSQHEGHR